MIMLNNWCFVRDLAGRIFITGNCIGHPEIGDDAIRTSPIPNGVNPANVVEGNVIHTTGGGISNGNLYQLGNKLDGLWEDWCHENKFRFLIATHSPVERETESANG